MARSDYRLCDVCEGKAFYDAHLNYEQGVHDWSGEPIPADQTVRNGGELLPATRLDYLGDWAVICRDCAKTHRCVVVPIAQADEQEAQR